MLFRLQAGEEEAPEGFDVPLPLAPVVHTDARRLCVAGAVVARGDGDLEGTDGRATCFSCDHGFDLLLLPNGRELPVHDGEVVASEGPALPPRGADLLPAAHSPHLRSRLATLVGVRLGGGAAEERRDLSLRRRRWRHTSSQPVRRCRQEGGDQVGNNLHGAGEGPAKCSVVGRGDQSEHQGHSGVHAQHGQLLECGRSKAVRAIEHHAV
mmetsp:Transcript_4803/g.14008  ORF Transcript_4803/g.14008 Transcript_4803/m.14008 type:complete len:210 (-) Transcript_4803:608-1237(-)